MATKLVLSHRSFVKEHFCGRKGSTAPFVRDRTQYSRRFEKSTLKRTKLIKCGFQQQSKQLKKHVRWNFQRATKKNVGPPPHHNTSNAESTQDDMYKMKWAWWNQDVRGVQLKTFYLLILHVFTPPNGILAMRIVGTRQYTHTQISREPNGFAGQRRFATQ